MKREKKKIALFFLAGILIFEVALLSSQNNLVKKNLADLTPEEYSKYWMQEIKKKGAQNAYEEFKVENEKINGERKHVFAHIFGETLYDTMGIEGFPVCDQSFGFGCYHSFIIKAVSERGISIISKLDNACVEKYGPQGLGCSHGIGHGLMEYLGHDYQGLVNSLEECKKLTWKGKLLGCTSGVFMEFNTPLILDSIMVKDGKVEYNKAITQIRDFDSDNPYYPCDLIPEAFRPSCYYEIVPWWNVIYKGDVPSIEKLCGGIENNEFQKYCFISIGATFAASKNPDESISICTAMQDTTREDLCRAGASWRYFSIPEMRQLTSLPCANLPTARREFCLEESNIQGLRGNQ